MCGLQELWLEGSVAEVLGLKSTDSVVSGHGLSCSEASGSSWTRDGMHVSELTRGFFITELPGKPFTWLLKRRLSPSKG